MIVSHRDGLYANGFYRDNGGFISHEGWRNVEAELIANSKTFRVMNSQDTRKIDVEVCS